MGYLKRDQILNCEDIKTEEIEVKEWGGTVVIKTMNGQERDSFEASCIGASDGTFKMDNIRAKLVSKSVIDPDTKELMFTVADIEALGKKSAAGLDKIFSASQKLSKISEKDVEDLAKN